MLAQNYLQGQTEALPQFQDSALSLWSHCLTGFELLTVLISDLCDHKILAKMVLQWKAVKNSSDIAKTIYTTRNAISCNPRRYEYSSQCFHLLKFDGIETVLKLHACSCFILTSGHRRYSCSGFSLPSLSSSCWRRPTMDGLFWYPGTGFNHRVLPSLHFIPNTFTNLLAFHHLKFCLFLCTPWQILSYYFLRTHPLLHNASFTHR
jgi:hypothetical protein